MKLHHDKRIFRQAIQFTSDQMGILPIYIEKDYWVTYALHIIFNNEIGKDVVFKGGTALSKCYKIIERFSEDIDLIVLRAEGETDNRLKAKLKIISNLVSDELPEIEMEGITHKMGMNRKTVHTYSKEFTGIFGQVREVIVLESSWLGYYEPYTNQQLVSFIGSMMLNNGQNQIAEENGLMPFDVRVLDPTRTLCEKIMSLVRFSYGQNPMDDLMQKIRHNYDLHQLLKQKVVSDFLDSSAFDKMLLKVANDDVKSYRNNNQWLANHPNQALIFNDLDNVWNELRVVYNGSFKNLVYGELPNDMEVLATLKRINERLLHISWEINVNP